MGYLEPTNLASTYRKTEQSLRAACKQDVLQANEGQIASIAGKRHCSVCWMSHCRGSPCLVTLVPVCGIPVSQRLGSRMHTAGRRDDQSRVESSTCPTLGGVAHRAL